MRRDQVLRDLDARLRGGEPFRVLFDANVLPDVFRQRENAVPAEIERDEDGRYVVTFPDFGWGATDGATRDEALAEAKDLLRELIATTIREGGALPEPSRRDEKYPIVVPRSKSY